MTAADLKDLYERQSRAFTRRPGFAAGSGHARVQPLDDLRCAVVQADRTIVVDLPPEEGGGGTAAHPGQLMRASLAACLAIGYRLWAARLDIPIDRIELELTCSYDSRGQLGLDDAVAVGWSELHVAVTAHSPAPPARIQHLITHANRLSPMLANLSPTIRQHHHLTVLPPTAP